MSPDSSPELLTLHAVRVLGFADASAIAARFGRNPEETLDDLQDAEARGWVQHASFAGLEGWSLTEAGRTENERLLTAELQAAGAGDEVRSAYEEFVPLNTRLQRACTDWQLRPGSNGRLDVNDHTDGRWDQRILDELTDLDRSLSPLVERLAAALTRFGGYNRRFSRALQRASAGEHGWVDRTDVDSCHRVWFELHEDLIATLGLTRGAQ